MIENSYKKRENSFTRRQKRHGTVTHIMNRIYEIERELINWNTDNLENKDYRELTSELKALKRALIAILPHTPLYVYKGNAESLKDALKADGKILFTGQKRTDKIIVYAGHELLNNDYIEIRLTELLGIMQQLKRPALLNRLCAQCGPAPKYYFGLNEKNASAILKGDLTAQVEFYFIGNPLKGE